MTAFSASPMARDLYIDGTLLRFAAVVVRLREISEDLNLSMNIGFDLGD